MTKYYQDIIDANRGDCLKMTISSLLDIDPYFVPHFIEYGDHWFSVMYQFLHRNGFEYICQLRNPLRDIIDEWNPEYVHYGHRRMHELSTYNGVGGLFYAKVVSPKYYNKKSPMVTHAVLCDKDFNIVHDPNFEYRHIDKYPLANVLGYNGILDVTIIERL